MLLRTNIHVPIEHITHRRSSNHRVTMRLIMCNRINILTRSRVENEALCKPVNDLCKRLSVIQFDSSPIFRSRPKRMLYLFLEETRHIVTSSYKYKLIIFLIYRNFSKFDFRLFDKLYILFRKKNIRLYFLFDSKYSRTDITNINISSRQLCINFLFLM